MGIESIVNVVVTSATTSISRQGFGTPLLLGATARAGTDLVRYYTTLAGVGADYATTTPEYRVAQRIFGQTLRPARLAIAKRTNVPTQRFTLVPTVANATRYAFRVGTAVVEYTSDASATLAEITAGLVAAFTALGEDAPDTATVSDVGPGTSVRVAGATAGAWNDVQVLTPNVLTSVQDSADTGVVAELDAILQAQPDWYGLLTLFPSQAEVLAIAGWVEANRKLFFYSSTDRAMWNVAYDPEDADDTVGGALKSRNYARSYLFPQTSTGDLTDVAAMGYLLASAPGGTTLDKKQLVGVPALTLTANQENNLKSYNANVLVTIAGLTLVLDGKSAAGTFVDLTRDTDWHVAGTQEDVLAVLAQPGKVPYTDAGVSLLTAAVSARAQRSTVAGLFSEGWTVTTVPVEEIPAEYRATRNYPGITLTARYAGAIHSVDPLTMTLYV